MKYGVLAIVALLGIATWDGRRGRSVEAPIVRPSEVTDFRALYGQNCSACHGADGQGAMAVGIGRPAYLAIADDATIRRVTAEGVRGTAMTAFAQKSGGLLTDAQIDVLVRGVREHWGKLGASGNDKPPAYAASAPGDVARGENVFKASCSSCHGPDGRGSTPIVDSSYLALVSDQHVRTIVIAGMPHLGMPDFRGHARPLTDADVTDVVAWLVNHRGGIK
jgi:mono/diheme cytochrome c family protein